jgi:hypothetical protein
MRALLPEVDVYSTGLVSATMWMLFERIDGDVAERVRLAGCPCGGRLHHADYPRMPRAKPGAPWRSKDRRTSFCCALDGCRHRRTPPSVRFLGRKVYVGAVVTMVTVLRHGPTPERLERLREIFGMCARTVRRWRLWWKETFVASAFWRGARGLFAPAVPEADLPASLLERFSGDGAERLCAALRFVSPVTTSSCSTIAS